MATNAFVHVRTREGDELEAATVSSASAARALEALAAELPHFEGRAQSLGGSPGGMGASTEGRDSALQRRRGLAHEAMRRLGTMWHRGERDEVLVLWLAYVRGGAEGRARAAKRPGAWFEELGYQLLPPAELGPALHRASRRGAGPDAAAARVRGAEVLARAEALFAETAPAGDDGAWLVVLRADADARASTYAELVERVVAEQRVERKRGRAGPVRVVVALGPRPPPGESMDLYTAARVVDALGFEGAALRARMERALLAGEYEAVVDAAVTRGLAEAFVELLAGVTDDDRDEEGERPRCGRTFDLSAEWFA